MKKGIKTCRRCGYCLEQKDAYCRHCGSKRVEESYDPQEASRLIQLLYGPPIVTVHICKDCDLKWEIHRLGYSNEYYCPKCGKKVEREYN